MAHCKISIITFVTANLLTKSHLAHIHTFPVLHTTTVLLSQYVHLEVVCLAAQRSE